MDNRFHWTVKDNTLQKGKCCQNMAQMQNAEWNWCVSSLSLPSSIGEQ